MTETMLLSKTFSGRLPRALLGATLGVTLFGSTACSSSSSGGATAGTNPPSLCSTDTRATVYASSMVVKGTSGTFSVRLDAVTPWPLVKGENTLTVTVVDAAGNAVMDPTVTLKPFMPDHGHGSSIVPLINPAKPDGSIEIDHVNTFMPGIWQLTFTVTKGGQSDSSVVTFCVPD
jgi:hypothetical protein